MNSDRIIDAKWELAVAPEMIYNNNLSDFPKAR
jgi:hypothetical protein